MIQLIEIGQTGVLPLFIARNESLISVVEATIKLYKNSGYLPPWVSYVALKNDVAVGTCAFKSRPSDGRVEIAYFTFPGHEGEGIATNMVVQLIEIARQTNTEITLVAQTLPEESASTTILKKLGFRNIGSVDHPEDNLVWEWELGL